MALQAQSTKSVLNHAGPKVAANIKMYTEAWDAIINAGRFELFNEERQNRGVSAVYGYETGGGGGEMTLRLADHGDFNVRFDLDVLPFSELRQAEAEAEAEVKVKVKVKVENLEGWESQANQA